VTLRDETWHADVLGLVRALRGEPLVPTRHRRRRRLVAAVAAFAIAALAGAGWWWTTDDNDAGGEDGEAATPPCAPPTGEDWTTIVLNDHPTVEVAAETEEEEEGFSVVRVRKAFWRQRDTNSWEVILVTGMRVNVRPDSYHEDSDYEQLVVGGMAFDKACFAAAGDYVITDTVGTALVGYNVTCEPVGYMQLVLSGGKRISVTKESETGIC
jgi:hypothetical protein